MPPSETEFEAAGLYHPAAPDAADRLALLTWLTAQGISIGQLLALGSDRPLITLAGDLAIRPGDRMTVAEAAARAGVPLPLVERIRLAAGLPPVPPAAGACTDADVESWS